jgi:hypothetical protein
MRNLRQSCAERNPLSEPRATAAGSFHGFRGASRMAMSVVSITSAREGGPEGPPLRTAKMNTNPKMNAEPNVNTEPNMNTNGERRTPEA